LSSSAADAVTFSAYAKVNIGLRVVRRRPDGFHDIETLFQSIDLADTLAFERREKGEVGLECDHPGLSAGRENLVVRAAEALRSAFSTSAGVRIILRKRIPLAAGLGGGSADAACALLALRKLWRIPATDDALAGIAARLGSDVPFFLYGGTALGRGRGERLQLLPDYPSFGVLLLSPDIRISTAEVYGKTRQILTDKASESNITPSYWERSCREGTLPDAWGSLKNDLEEIVFQDIPELPQLKQKLEDCGSFFASMSGSGPSIFGIFENPAKAAQAADRFAGQSLRATVCSFVSRAVYADQFR
jgi:4-diphosphocytidyl-2-C-methyl-D-erythritol kinase